MIENIEIIVKSNAEKETNPLKDLRKEINGLKSDLLQLEAGTEEYNAKALELANATKTLKDINEEARFAAADLGDQLATTNRIATGLASGFSAVQGVMALFGAEGENLQKIMVKLQAGIALVQGLQGMEGLVRDLEIAKIQFRGGLTAVKGFIGGLSGVKKALLATGIGAFIVLIGVLIANWEKIASLFSDTSPQEKAKKAAREYRIELEKLAAQSSADKIVKIKELSRAYRQFGEDLESKKKFVTKYKEELAKMGIEMNNVNDADRIFIEKTNNYIAAVMARAKADAARKMATTDFEEYLVKKREYDERIVDAQEKYDAAKKEYDENADSYSAQVATAGNKISTTGTAPARPANQASNPYQIKLDNARTSLSNLNNELQELTDDVNAKMESAFLIAEKFEQEASQYLTIDGGSSSGSGSGGSGSGGSGISSVDTAAEAKKIAERAKQALIDTKEEELAELKRVYEEELALLQQHNIATGDLTKEYLDKQTELLKEIENFEGGNEQEQLTALENFYNERIRIYTEAGVSTVELTAQFEAEKNAIIENYENQRQEALTQIANDSKSEKELEIQELTEEYNTYLELFKNHKEQLLLVEEWYQSQMDAITERYKDENDKDEEDEDKKREEKIQDFIASYGELFTYIDEKAGRTAANVSVSFVEALNSASQIIGALQAGIDTTTKEGFEKNKKYQIAQAGISMAQGILAAISTAMTVPPPMGPIIGAINAATVATVGGIQIDNIKKQKFDGSGGGSDGISVPNVSATMMPNEVYANQLATQTEIDLQSEQTNTRVYVVESDITESQNSAKTKVSESEF